MGDIVKRYYLEYCEGTSNKFYEIIIEEIETHRILYQVQCFSGKRVTYRKTCDGIRQQNKSFLTMKTAVQKANHIRDSKLTKGYKLMSEELPKEEIRKLEEKKNREGSAEDISLDRFSAILE